MIAVPRPWRGFDRRARPGHRSRADRGLPRDDGCRGGGGAEHDRRLSQAIWALASDFLAGGLAAATTEDLTRLVPATTIWAARQRRNRRPCWRLPSSPMRPPHRRSRRQACPAPGATPGLPKVLGHEDADRLLSDHADRARVPLIPTVRVALRAGRAFGAIGSARDAELVSLLPLVFAIEA